MLSGIEPPDLVQAVQRADVVRLTAIPGVGKKTAERIVLELKDRVAALGVLRRRAPRPRPAPVPMRDDLLSALLNLGYHRPAADKAVDRVAEAGRGGVVRDGPAGRAEASVDGSR